MAKLLCEHGWIAEVDIRFRRRWHIGAADAGLSKEDLKRHWNEHVSPTDFVDWFAKKYDLIDFEDETKAHHAIINL